MEEKRFDTEQTNEFGEKGYFEKKIRDKKYSDITEIDVGGKYPEYITYYKHDVYHTKKFVLNDTDIELKYGEFSYGHPQRYNGLYCEIGSKLYGLAIDISSKGMKKHFENSLNIDDWYKFRSLKISDYDALAGALAYVHAMQNVNKKLVGDKDLNKMSLNELEELNSKKEEILKKIEQGIKQVCIGEHVDFQEILDETFGKGTVDLYKMVEEGVTSELNKKTARGEKRVARHKKVESIKKSLTKVVLPSVKLAGNIKKVAENLKRKRQKTGEERFEQKRERKIEKEEEKRRDDIIDNLRK